MEFGAAFWVGVAFLVFVGAIMKPVGRIVIHALDQRSARIRKDLDDAAALRAQAEALLADYQKKQREVLEEARTILAHAEEEAQQRIQAAEKEIEHVAERKLHIALARLSSAETAVLDAVRQHAVDVAAQTVRLVLTDPANQNWGEEFSDAAITQIAKRLS